jgi:hypothetical protein
MLNFSESNKENFAIDEVVNLRVSIKNVKQMVVKIFEFNTETYYMKNKAVFNTGVNLEGLEASDTLSFDYDQPSNVKHDESFAFPQLNNKIGLFIIEFIGNGKSCRSVIKKGSLAIIHKSTVAGHMVYMLDHDKKICKGERTGVWFDGKFYKAEMDNGRIFIPYGQRN